MASRCGWLLSLCVVLAVASAIGAAVPADVKKTVPTDRFGDPLPAGAVARMGTVRFRHAGAVRFVAYLQDGKTILSVGTDDLIRWWEGDSGREIRRCAAGHMFAGSAWLSRDHTILAAMVGDDVRMWDAPSGKTPRKLEAPDVRVSGIALSANGALLATCGKHLRLWDAATGVQIREFAGPEDAFNNAVFSPDGKTLVSAGDDGAIRWWDVTSGKMSNEAQGGKNRLLDLSADGKRLATYDTEHILRIWDAGLQKEMYVAPADKRGRYVCSLAFSSDHKVLATGAEDGVIRLYDATSGDELRRCVGHQEAVLSVAFSPNDATLVSGGDCTVRQWDVRTAREIRPFAGAPGQVGALAVSPDGATVASGGIDSRVHLWNAVSGQERRSLAGCEGEAIESLGFSPNGTTLASISRTGRSAVHVWSTTDGTPINSFCPADKGYPGPFALSSDAATVAASGGSDRIALFDPARGEIIQEYTESGRGSLQLGPFIEGGKRLAVFHHNGGPNSKADALLLWDVSTGGHEMQPLRGDVGGVFGCTAWPDGKILAVAGAEGHMGLWNTTTGDSMRGWQASKDYVLATAFSADGRMLATSELDGSISVWEVVNGQRRRLFRGGQGFIDALTFSPDGRRLYSGGHDGTVLAWNLTGASMSPIEADEKTLEKLWNDLGGGDADVAYGAVWRLAAISEQAAPYLSAHLRHPSATPARIAQWIVDLDSDDFQARERASAALRRAEEMAEPSLKTALAANPSPEARRRIEELLDWLSRVRKGLHPPEPQVVRAIEALEIMGTPAAKDALAQFAEGPETSLSREAKSSLERMRRRAAIGAAP